MKKAFPEITIESRAQLRRWLKARHCQTDSVWIVSFKKGQGPHVPYGEIRDEALCFGWIDSVPGKVDAARSKLLLSPRKVGSGWSAVNKARIETLEKEGLMTSAGLAPIEEAKRDGSWSRLDEAHALITPPDLAQAFKKCPGSQAKFDAFSPSSKRAILEWITNAKTALTREKRVDETARLAALGLRANFPVDKPKIPVR